MTSIRSASAALPPAKHPPLTLSHLLHCERSGRAHRHLPATSHLLSTSDDGARLGCWDSSPSLIGWGSSKLGLCLLPPTKWLFSPNLLASGHQVPAVCALLQAAPLLIFNQRRACRFRSRARRRGHKASVRSDDKSCPGLEPSPWKTIRRGAHPFSGCSYHLRIVILFCWSHGQHSR
jgi:hypothetical protein